MRALCLIALALLLGIAVRAWRPTVSPSLAAARTADRPEQDFPRPHLARRPDYRLPPQPAKVAGLAPSDFPDAEWDVSEPHVPASAVSTTRVWLPRNSVLVVGSLDLAGGLHEVTVSLDDPSEQHPAAGNSVPVQQIRTQLCLPQFGGPGLASAVGSSTRWPSPATSKRAPAEHSFASSADSGPSATPIRSERRPPIERQADQSADRERIERASGPDRRFRVPFFTTTGVIDCYRALQRVQQTSRLNLYADCEIPSHAAAAQAIADRLSAGLVQFVERQVAPISDPDQDGRLAIVVASLSDGQSAEELPILGCVRPADFYGRGPFVGDIIYLDPAIADEVSPDALLAHELAHAAVFSFAPESRCPGWLNESVAHLLEWSVDVNSPNLVRRIRDYQRHPERFPVVWSDSSSSRSLRRGPARIAGFTFFQSALQRNSPLPLRALFSEFATAAQSFSRERFAKDFRRWSAQMAPQVRQRNLLTDGHVLLRGTAFAAWNAGQESSWVTVTIPVAARAQISVVSAPVADLSPPLHPNAVSMAGNQPKAGRTVVEIPSE